MGIVRRTADQILANLHIYTMYFKFFMCFFIISVGKGSAKTILVKTTDKGGQNGSSKGADYWRTYWPGSIGPHMGYTRYECHRWTSEEQNIIYNGGWNRELERQGKGKEKPVCEARGPAYIFTGGDNADAPGCGHCWCCFALAGK